MPSSVGLNLSDIRNSPYRLCGSGIISYLIYLYYFKPMSQSRITKLCCHRTYQFLVLRKIGVKIIIYLTPHISLLSNNPLYYKGHPLKTSFLWGRLCLSIYSFLLLTRNSISFTVWAIYFFSPFTVIRTP